MKGTSLLIFSINGTVRIGGEAEGFGEKLEIRGRSFFEGFSFFIHQAY